MNPSRLCKCATGRSLASRSLTTRSLANRSLVGCVLTRRVLTGRVLQLAAATGAVASLVACSNFYQPTSPDVVYSSDPQSARALQVPPDLTDVSDGEQFILPGNTGGPVTRNTLLPGFDSIRYVREGSENWLAFTDSPEDVWPRLLEFLKREKYRVRQTDPTAGSIVTQWRAASDVDGGGLLKGLIGGDEAFTRVAFRLERDDEGARLFARQQAGPESLARRDNDAAADEATAAVAWPASTHDPEQVSALLQRLLVYLGVEEQRSRGLLDAEQQRAVLDDAALQTTAAGSQLLVNLGFEPTFRAVRGALEALDYPVSSSDDGVGRIEFVDGERVLVANLVPVHVSAVQVTLSEESGRRLDAEAERALLGELRDRIA